MMPRDPIGQGAGRGWTIQHRVCAEFIKILLGYAPDFHWYTLAAGNLQLVNCIYPPRRTVAALGAK